MAELTPFLEHRNISVKAIESFGTKEIATKMKSLKVMNADEG